MVSLCFLAAERPAHTSDFHHHFILPDAEHLGNERLRFGRVLRRAECPDLVALTRYAKTYLRFEVPMFLSAGPQFTGEAMR